MTELPVVLREARRTDLPFVVHSWLESLAKDCYPRERICVDLSRWMDTITPDAPELPATFFVYRQWHDIVEACTETERVLVAAFTEDPDYILGWVCATRREPAIVLYSYVRGDKRRMGLGRFLCESLGLGESLSVAFWSRDCEHIANTHKMVYSHFAAKEIQHVKAKERFFEPRCATTFSGVGTGAGHEGATRDRAGV